MSIDAPCTYIETEQWRFEYFFASGLDEQELSELLKRGWRKFGEYYFRPCCERCARCIPIRVVATSFKPSKTQRRVANRCSALKVQFTELEFKEEIFTVYRDHSLTRFGKESDPDDFISAFYTQSCPALQSEYYLDGELIAVGFLDRAKDSLSSVYFAFKSAYENYRLGTFSVIKEIEYTASLGLKYYYLGYYIPENHSMAYKNQFHPNEKYDWGSNNWSV